MKNSLTLSLIASSIFLPASVVDPENAHIVMASTRRTYMCQLCKNDDCHIFSKYSVHIFFADIRMPYNFHLKHVPTILASDIYGLHFPIVANGKYAFAFHMTSNSVEMCELIFSFMCSKRLSCQLVTIFCPVYFSKYSEIRRLANRVTLSRTDVWRELYCSGNFAANDIMSFSVIEQLDIDVSQSTKYLSMMLRTSALLMRVSIGQCKKCVLCQGDSDICR